MERFKDKNPNELQDQLENASESLGTEISQESSTAEILNLSLDEIKSKYPERYKIYLKLLRAQKNKQEIDPEELEEMREWISALNNLDSYINHHHQQHEQLDSRGKKQLDIFEDIRDSLEKGNKEGYIKLPTGVGKTVLFSRVVESLGLKTLVVVPSKILIKQTGEKFEKFTDVEFGKFFQGEKDLSKGVTIMTYSSLMKGIDNGSVNPEEYQVLILDEAHKAMGEETSKAVDKFNGIKIGFTATPKYSRKKHLSNLLEREMHSMSIIEAVREGLISRFKSYIAYTDTDLSSVDVKGKERYNADQLEKVINQEARNQSAVDLYKNQFNGHLAIAYCGGVEHAKYVAELFNKSGVTAEIISGESLDNDKILERFNRGETKVLCNARVLIEGFDEPKASVCLNLHPTLSLVDAEQRAGRVLRLDPDSPEKWGYVVDFLDQGLSVSPLTFAEIAQASEMDVNHSVTFSDFSSKNGDNPSSEHERDVTPNIYIQGLRVVVDAIEVLKITRELEMERTVEKKEFVTLDELKNKVQEAGIKDISQYRRMIKGNPDLPWPTTPERTYPEWISWPDLFGRERKKFLELDELKKVLKKSGIESVTAYRKSLKDNKTLPWPSSPEGFYPDWISWPDLFGREKKNFLKFDELKKAVNEAGVKSKTEYLSKLEESPDLLWPNPPDVFYPDCVSCLDFLNKEKKTMLSLNELKVAVRELKILSSMEYQLKRKEDPDLPWPSEPHKIYPDWISWPELFGKEAREKKEFLTLDDLKFAVKERGIKGKNHYLSERMKHRDLAWPSSPNRTYPDWISWPDLFGN